MSSKIDQSHSARPAPLQAALSTATEAALEAGALLREALYQGAAACAVESSGEVHALADLQAERVIRARLTARFPDWGMRSEEEPELNTAPQDDLESFWLVDPNDGTSAFIKGERGASVSIALIQRGEPVLGVIYAYMGLDDRGDLFTWARGCGPLKRNGSPVHSLSLWATRWREATAFVSNSADAIADAYHASLDGARFRVAPGVAYRLALVAAGEGDLATSLAGPRDFDYAAGHALMIGAGGRFIDERGRGVRYHPERPQRLGFSFGGAPLLVERLTSLAWGPVLKREGQRAVTLRAPRHADLLNQAGPLASALGAWWGWHLAWSLTSPDHLEARRYERLLTLTEGPAQLHELEAHVARQGGDSRLYRALREALNVTPCAEPPTLLSHPLRALLAALLSGHEPRAPSEGGEDLDQRDALCLRCARMGVDLATARRGSALSAGGRSWPPRLIGALLSCRVGEMEGWGSDSPRLLEAWLTVISAEQGLVKRQERR